jgi:hypothetical protein
MSAVRDKCRPPACTCARGAAYLLAFCTRSLSVLRPSSQRVGPNVYRGASGDAEVAAALESLLARHGLSATSDVADIRSCRCGQKRKVGTCLVAVVVDAGAFVTRVGLGEGW